jgi:hypothetical protein
MVAARLALFVACLSLVFSPAALADSSTTLALTSFGGLTVDYADGYVFVSGGSGSSSVVVLDAIDGTVVTTISGLSGPSGMALDEGSSTLYVAQEDGSSLAVIDAANTVSTGSIALSPTASPRQVAIAGGRVWFSHDCTGPGAKVASILADGTDLNTYPVSNFVVKCPVFAVSPTDSNTLVMGDTGVSPTTIQAWDVSGDPALLSGAWNAGSTNFLEDLTVSVDGASVLTAAAWPYASQSLALDDYAVEASYATTTASNSVALSADGEYVAAGRAGTSGPDVYVYNTSTGSLVRTYELGATKTLKPRGLAFSDDASKLYAVAGDAASGKIVVHVLGSPTTATLAPTSVSLNASASKLQYKRSVHLTAHVNGATTGSIAIYATPFGETRQLVGTGTVDGSGKFTASWVMKQKTTFTAEYEGDDSHAISTSAGRVVSVYAVATMRMTNYYGKSGKYRLYRSGHYPTGIGSVVPNHRNLPLKFVAEGYFGGKWRVVARRTLYIGATGSIGVYLKSKTRGMYRLHCIFAGDSDHLADTSPWSHFRIT